MGVVFVGRGWSQGRMRETWLEAEPVLSVGRASCVGCQEPGLGREGWRRGREGRCRHSLRMIRMPRMKRIPAMVRPPILRVW